MKGTLTETVKEEDCMWNMDGDNIDVTLQKTNTMHWWKAVLEGEPEINVQKVSMHNTALLPRVSVAMHGMFLRCAFLVPAGEGYRPC